MSMSITMQMPDEVFSILRTSKERFAEELRLAAAVKWYEIGRISQSKAAELAGISRQEFIDRLNGFQVSPLQISIDELEADLKID